MKLIYEKSQLEADHDYVTLHVECGLRLHGGFDQQGRYLSPRTRYRSEAIAAWHQQLNYRGVPVLEASTQLLTEPNFPNVPQQIFLLQQGLEQSLWDSLTITGLIEARGKFLAEMTAPDFQEIVVEDLAGTALGHMQKGLLSSHGWDEGGVPGSGIGGHDAMWYVVRDLVFGKDRFPVPVAPASISRDKSDREMEALPPEHGMVLSLLMNLLMIEVRAERTFDFYEQVISAPESFPDRPKEAAHAVELVHRIRQDESVHVAWLQAAISEFRSFTIRCCDGVQRSGAAIIDPVWQKMVHWHAVELHETTRPLNMARMKESLMALEDGERMFAAFEALGD